MPGRTLTVNSRKFDGTINRTWECRPIGIADSQLVLVGSFAHDVEHPELGRIAAGTISYEFFWPDRWYNVFRFHEPDGSLRNFYYNISMPYSFDRGQLDYVDLDIDIIVWPDGTFRILDLAEFDQNKVNYAYPADVIANAERTMHEIISAIRDGSQPTDFLLTGHLPGAEQTR